MPTYVFQAKTPDGKFVKGELEAISEAEARVKLRAQKMVPLNVVGKGLEAKKTSGKSFLKDSVSPKDLQVFTRQFAVLVSAGVPIVQSLEAMITGSRSAAMGRAVEKVVEEIEKGRRLADAMAMVPDVFDRMYVNLIRAGEEGGVLDTVLNRLAEYIEKSVMLRGRILGALWYPGAVIVVAFAVIAGIMIFVIPSFVDMFKNSGQELPALTRWVMSASYAFVQYWFFICATVIGIPLGFRAYYKTPDGKKVLDPILIEVPIFGSLMQKGAIARMSRTLATLLSAGVRILDSLDIAANTAGNWVIEKAILDARESVSRGKSLTEPLRRVRYIPTMVTQMIAVGESTGNLDTMLGKIADFYESEVEAAADALTSLIEPLLMVFLGGIIAVIVIAMYLPIFNMASIVGG